MIRINVDFVTATVAEKETLTGGLVGLVCSFTFSQDWDGLARIALFEGAETKAVVLDATNACVIPPEVMAQAGYRLRIGATGISPDGDVVIPTIWAKVGKILESAGLSDDELEQATPSVVGQIIDKSNAALALAQNVANKADNGDFDGYSPAVTVSEITGGHSVNITDKDHPTGQSFNVMDGTDGTDGEGVPASGTTGQYLRKKSGTDYDTEWATLPADEVFWATKDTTTSAQIEAAYQAGKVCLCNYSSRTYRLNYRTSSTKHTFTMTRGNTVYALECDNDSWSSTTYALAQSANIPAAATDNPADLGTAAKGSSTKYARQDHVHKMPSASDVGAIAAPASPSAGDVLTYSGGAWGAAAPASVPSAATNTPADLGTAAVGSSSKYAKEDHVHNKPSYSAADVGAAPAITEVTVSTAGAVTQALDPGKLYHFTGALTALTVTLTAAAAGQIAHYHFDFNCGSTAPTVTIPNTVTMPSGNTFDASKHYEVDILNNYGAVMAWATS